MQRPMERYRILNVWKMLKGHIPNCGLEFTSEAERRGTELIIPNLNKSSQREQSFQGSLQFNPKVPKTDGWN